MLKKYHILYFYYRDKATETLERFKNSRISQWFFSQRQRIAMMLYIMWFAGCGYWLYQFMSIDATPYRNLMVIMSDTREAIVFAFFGIIGGIFVLAFAVFLIKLLYNIFHGGLTSLFPRKWYSVTRPLGYLILLFFAFSYIENIKKISVTAYKQTRHVVDNSRQHDEMTAESFEHLIDFINKTR